MSLFENFPYTNLHELNLNWLINQIKNLTENMVISVNGQTGEVVLYQNATVEFPAVTDNHWSIVRSADGTARGIMFGNDNKAYILHDSYMNEVYAANNPPPYPVTSVNGQTGAITLYSDRVVRLPSLTDEEIHSWNIFRDMNSVSSGIEFDEAGDAYIIFGTQRYKLYSTKNAQTIVTSVNGEHGEVDLFTDSNGEVAFPAFVDPLYDGWMIRRDVNDDRIGLLLKQDGTLSLIINDAVYTVYNSNNPQPDWVNDPTASMIQISASANGAMWGFIRNTSIAPVGILFDNTQQNSPKAYVQYTDSNNVVQTVQLITMADIPQSSVISVNGQGGIVVLTGADINVSGSDTRKINTVLSSLETAKQVNRQAMAYNETSNIASNDIPAGAYVFWNNRAYVASQNISYGDTLSSSNLTAVVDQYNQPCGFANALNSNLTTQFSMIDLGIISDMTSLISAISTLESSLGSDATRFVKFNTNTPTDYWYQWEYHTGIVQKDDAQNWTAVFAGTSGETLNIGSSGNYYSSKEEKNRISTLDTSTIDFYGFTLGQAKAITAKPYKRSGIAFGVWSTNMDSQKIIPFSVSIPANATTLTITEVTLYDTGKVTAGMYDVRIITWRAS